jgi:hypothetical protein
VVATLYVLIFRGQPIACAERFERLTAQMDLYTPTQKRDMHVVRVQLLEDT